MPVTSRVKSECHGWAWAMHMQERKSLVHGCLPAFPLVVVSQDGNGRARLIIDAEVRNNLTAVLN